jgi:cytochrome bd-type quinol oxidase subunit 2
MSEVGVNTVKYLLKAHFPRHECLVLREVSRQVIYNTDDVESCYSEWINITNLIRAALLFYFILFSTKVTRKRHRKKRSYLWNAWYGQVLFLGFHPYTFFYFPYFYPSLSPSQVHPMTGGSSMFDRYKQRSNYLSIYTQVGAMCQSFGKSFIKTSRGRNHQKANYLASRIG